MEYKKSRKSRLWLLIGMFFFIMFTCISFLVAKDLNQENKLVNELDRMENMINAAYTDENIVNLKLNTLVTEGEYAVIESSYKSYLKDYFRVVLEIKSILEDENVSNILAIKNYEIDGPKFESTKKLIETTLIKISDIKKEYEKLIDEDTIMSYIDGNNLDSYYVDFYLQEIVKDIERLDGLKVVNSLDSKINELNVSNKIIKLLSENSTKWSINNESIVFSDDSVKNNYEDLICEISN